MCQGITNNNNKKCLLCTECARQGKQRATIQKVVGLCPTLGHHHEQQIAEEKVFELDCAVCALRRRYFEPELNLEKRFQQTMKSKKIKAQLNRILFKPASTSTTDKLLEYHARRQHELAMEILRRERLMKLDRMYSLLEMRHYLSN